MPSLSIPVNFRQFLSISACRCHLCKLPSTLVNVCQLLPICVNCAYLCTFVNFCQVLSTSVNSCLCWSMLSSSVNFRQLCVNFCLCLTILPTSVNFSQLLSISDNFCRRTCVCRRGSLKPGEGRTCSLCVARGLGGLGNGVCARSLCRALGALGTRA